jgi:hypothetical protein
MKIDASCGAMHRQQWLRLPETEVNTIDIDYALPHLDRYEEHVYKHLPMKPLHLVKGPLPSFLSKSWLTMRDTRPRRQSLKRFSPPDDYAF